MRCLARGASGLTSTRHSRRSVPTVDAHPRPRRGPIRWKVVVAATAPWTGEVYHTHPGHQRRPFVGVEAFCGALIASTSWSLAPQARPDEDESVAELLPSAADEPTCPSHPPCMTVPAGPADNGKFIIAANSPWCGRLYRTRPGMRQFEFATFDEFMRALVTITRWRVGVVGDLAVGANDSREVAGIDGNRRSVDTARLVGYEVRQRVGDVGTR